MQIYISNSLEGLDYKKKYNGLDYTDSLEHLTIFGMYRQEDFEVAKNHNGELTIVWCGSDAKDLHTNWIQRIEKAKHISISNFISDRLNSFGIQSEYKPLNAVLKNEWSNYPNGDYLYLYYSSSAKGVYGEQMIKQIQDMTGIKVIKSVYGQYNKSELLDIYKKCFLNLRLTKFDGTPHTNIEMGLMGRKSIFNGSLPHSIKWNNINDICESIKTEYKNRKQNNIIITDTFKNLNDGM